MEKMTSGSSLDLGRKWPIGAFEAVLMPLCSSIIQCSAETSPILLEQILGYIPKISRSPVSLGARVLRSSVLVLQRMELLNNLLMQRLQLAPAHMLAEFPQHLLLRIDILRQQQIHFTSHAMFPHTSHSCT